MEIKCKNCQKLFHIAPSRLGVRFFCSAGCRKDFFRAEFVDYICAGCGIIFRDYKSNNDRKFCSKGCQTKNKKQPKGPASPRWSSKKTTCSYCHKVFYKWESCKNKRFCSRECHAASKRGIYPKNLRGKRGVKPRTFLKKKRSLYGSAEDREWRESVFKRDKWTCQNCGVRGGKLQAHHIKPYKEFPELRHDISNGLTLCVECHKKTDSYGWSKYWQKARRIEKETQQLRLFR